MKITIIAGSPRTGSLSFRAASFLHGYFTEHFPDHKFTLLDVRDHPLPPIQKPFGTMADVPEKWKLMGETIFHSDAFVLVSPEYNGGYSATMKNLLDYFPKHSRKTFGLVTCSPGAMGGIRAAMQLQQLVAALFGVLCPNMLITPAVDKKFNEKNELIDETFQKSIDVFAKEFIWLAEVVHGKK